jgi:hypothetical protein
MWTLEKVKIVVCLFLITNSDFLSTKQFCFSFFVSTLFFGEKKNHLDFRSKFQKKRDFRSISHKASMVTMLDWQ